MNHKSIPRRLPSQHIPLYRGVIHKDGRQYHLGMFLSQQVRDETVATARGMLAMGADVITVVRTLRR